MTHDSTTPRWWQNPNIQSALITGFLGLLGTAITIYATRPPAPAPVPTPPNSFTNVDSHAQNNSATNPSDAFATGSSHSLAQPPIDLRLNFAEYQRLLAKPGVTKEEEARYAGPLMGKTVIWEGYFDNLTMATRPLEGSYFTIALVENQAKVTQSMLKTPAIFRMPASELATAQKLRRGQFIKVMGTLQDFSLVASVVTNGHILEPPASETARVASGSTSTSRQ